MGYAVTPTGRVASHCVAALEARQGKAFQYHLIAILVHNFAF